jgi:23S rRNA (guanosine2251-2'-O)-methyltransferase
MTPILARHPDGLRLRECTVMSPSQPPATSAESPGEDSDPSPKDRFVTVYGRKPVLEALSDPALQVDKVVLAEGADPRAVRPLLDAARTRGIPVRRASAQRVKVLAGNGRQDQGVIADVVAPGMRTVERFVASLGPDDPARVLVLDGLTNPANVGMILRSATAAGLDGVLLPRRGAPSIDPLVVKASAGVAFHAPVLRAGTAAAGLAALAESGFVLLGLDGAGRASLFSVELPPRVAIVVGGETDGLTDDVRGELHDTVVVPMAAGVESLNAACAATLACFELARR